MSTEQRRTPLIAATVAVAVMLTGGGVAYMASSGGLGADSAGKGGEDPPPLVLDAASPEDAAPYGGGEPLSLSGELPDGPGSAAVYAAKGQVAAKAVAGLAKALKVDGKPRLKDGAWLVGSTANGQGPLLRVEEKAPGSWSYQRYAAPQPEPCLVPTPEPGPSGDLPEEKPEDSVKPCASGDVGTSDGQALQNAVPEDAAKALAAPVFKALGLDDAKIDATHAFRGQRSVNADPVVDGLPTWGWRTSLQVNPEREIVSANGRLGEAVKGHTYPVISAQEALKALNNSRGGAEAKREGDSCASAVPYDSESGMQPPAVGKVSPCDFTLPPAKVRGAEFGLSGQLVSGKLKLVPSWLFEVTSAEATGYAGKKAGSTLWPYPAVHPDYIQRAEPPSPGQSGAPDDPDSPTAGPGSPGQEEPAQPSPSETVKQVTPMQLTSYSISGNELTVVFWGGVCSDYSISDTETASAVKVRVIGVEKKPGQVCIKLAKEFRLSVQLEKALGERTVVDASSGKNVSRK